MKAEIITIGDELLIGQVVNTNQAFIAETLNSLGIDVVRMTTVNDEMQAILSSFEEAIQRCDVIAVTGGLGPTHDDVTRSAVCKFFQTDLVSHEDTLERIKTFFASRGLQMLKINEEQALVPRGCTVIQNLKGTAPGYFFERGGKFFIVMPGVPFEMKAMMEDFVAPYFQNRGSNLFIRHRTLKTTGIPESFLADLLGRTDDLFAGIPGISLAYLPSPTGVRLRITARTQSSDEATQAIRGVEHRIRQKAEKYIYGADEQELEDVIGRLLTERRMTISVAESCTGGLIADRLTDVSGSSKYFERGIIVYSNDSKVVELGVPTSFIEHHGTVSREVAEALAIGIRTKSNTDIGLSTTGVAGPTGGSAEKPVGLVWIGYSDRKETLALRFNFGADRRRVKERAAQAALELVRRKLLKIVKT